MVNQEVIAAIVIATRLIIVARVDVDVNVDPLIMEAFNEVIIIVYCVKDFFVITVEVPRIMDSQYYFTFMVTVKVIVVVVIKVVHPKVSFHFYPWLKNINLLEKQFTFLSCCFLDS